ncbi:hypothetical protein DPMN_157819 [Dreissena polymorpha]|uniref:Uncharacterized protein n=1 Tax=Dreissena polymorpha TaxID=45954 RepID=A0A9D4EI03_DREPO|nr:hypothetical protein DPMN_157819 [Dreissena polymorpha]
MPHIVNVPQLPPLVDTTYRQCLPPPLTRRYHIPSMSPTYRHSQIPVNVNVSNLPSLVDTTYHKFPPPPSTRRFHIQSMSSTSLNS